MPRSLPAIPFLSRAPMALLVLASLGGLAGCADDPSTGGEAGFPEQPYTTIESDQGTLRLAVRTAPSQPPSRGLTSVEFAVVGEGAAGDIELEVVPWMPSMSHGGAVAPASANGEGRYVASDVEMYMPGRWELRARISGAVSDSATVVFDIP